MGIARALRSRRCTGVRVRESTKASRNISPTIKARSSTAKRERRPHNVVLPRTCRVVMRALRRGELKRCALQLWISNSSAPSDVLRRWRRRRRSPRKLRAGITLRAYTHGSSASPQNNLANQRPLTRIDPQQSALRTSVGRHQRCADALDAKIAGAGAPANAASASLRPTARGAVRRGPAAERNC